MNPSTEADVRAGHVLIDGKGRFLSVDRGFGDIMRTKPTSLIGRSVATVTAPADRDECHIAIARLRATRIPFEICKRFLRDDGSLVWVNNTVSMVENGRDPDVMVATISPVVEPEALRAPALLLESAHLTLALRQERFALFDTGLFTDRAWEIMLSAYVAEAEGRVLTVSTLIDEHRMSAQQADRWIAALVADRVIEVETRGTDAHALKGFRLTGSAHARLENYLSNASRLRGGQMRSRATS